MSCWVPFTFRLHFVSEFMWHTGTVCFQSDDVNCARVPPFFPPHPPTALPSICWRGEREREVERERERERERKRKKEREREKRSDFRTCFCKIMQIPYMCVCLLSICQGVLYVCTRVNGNEKVLWPLSRCGMWLLGLRTMLRNEVFAAVVN